MATAECHARGWGCTTVGVTWLHWLYSRAVESGAGKDGAEESKDASGEENDENDVGENGDAAECVVRVAAVIPTARSSRRRPWRPPCRFIMAMTVDSAKWKYRKNRKTWYLLQSLFVNLQ